MRLAGPWVCVCRPNLSVRAYGYGTEGFHKVSIVEIFFFPLKFLDQHSPLLKNFGVFLENPYPVQVSILDMIFDYPIHSYYIVVPLIPPPPSKDLQKLWIGGRHTPLPHPGPDYPNNNFAFSLVFLLPSFTSPLSDLHPSSRASSYFPPPPSHPAFFLPDTYLTEPQPCVYPRDLLRGFDFLVPQPTFFCLPKSFGQRYSAPLRLRWFQSKRSDRPRHLRPLNPPRAIRDCRFSHSSRT